ncbi:MAG: EF-P beta-lysylation protein EpmB, partial [Thiotrichaceae bacterium]|nr:EF-P beta-lysylation protein EpmB [Thiotrichaceae bacterium]
MITDLKKLSQELDVDLVSGAVDEQSQDFPLLVPKSFVKRMGLKNLTDPLLSQVLPKKIELEKVVGFSVDPIDEINRSPVHGLIHKYAGRILLLVTNTCAINCRFCFRRHLQ